MSIISVNPFRCRMWDFHDRLECHLSEESCRAEIDSFLRHGQLVPALGRELRGDPDYDIELIYGARRLFVARHINKPLKVDVRPVRDREAIVAMDIENRQRMDVSPYERGVSYARWLRTGHFESQEDLARALKVSPSQVSRLLKLARLPSVIVGVFDSPANICEGWGLKLMDALDDPGRRALTVSKARAIAGASPRPPGREIFRQLLAASTPGRKPASRARDEVVRAGNGEALFRVRKQTSLIAVLLPVERVSEKSMQRIRSMLTEILQPLAPESLERHGEKG